MNKLYIIRHGKTDWNNLRLMQGRVDIPLNEEGREDAVKLTSSINLSDIDICLSSPLKRARETAEIIVQNKLKIIYDDLLIERDFGDYEGCEVNFDLIQKQWDYNLNDKSGNIESIKECLNRAKVFLDKLKKDYPNKTILIISHGSFIKALHFNIIGYDENTDFLSFRPANTRVYEYDY